MIHKCQCTLCKLARINEESKVDPNLTCDGALAPGDDDYVEPKGTPKEILEGADKIVSLDIQTTDMKYIDRSEEHHGNKTFRYKISVSNFSVRLQIYHQHKAITRSNPQAMAFIWQAPNGIDILSSIHAQFSPESVYLLGANKKGPTEIIKTFIRKSEAQDYYFKVAEALRWFLTGPASTLVAEHEEMYPERTMLTIHEPGIFKATIELHGADVIFEVLEQHPELYNNTNKEGKVWVNFEGYEVISDQYVMLGTVAAYLRGSLVDKPNRICRIFGSKQKANAYYHGIARALDRFRSVAKAHVERMVAITDEKRLAEEQRDLERQPGLYGRQGYFTYHLIKTSRRLTFDIVYQHPLLVNNGSDDDYYHYKAKNGVEIISQSRMDIQTNRLWLRGCVSDDRSGSMVFSDNAKRDKMYYAFQDAIAEWFDLVAGPAVRDGRHIKDIN